MLKRLSLIVSAIALSFVALSFLASKPAVAYICKSDECNAAKAAMESAQNAANTAYAEVNSLSAIISSIDREIAVVDAEIHLNEVEIEDLRTQISAMEAKLELQKSALASLLVELHFEETSDAVTILAGSSSIGELAERESRRDSLKGQISSAAKELAADKAELEEQKLSVELKLETNEKNRAIAAERRAVQNTLRAQAQASANDAQATADYWEEQVRNLAWTPPSDTTGWGYRNWDRIDTYPYQDNCPQDNVLYSAYGGAVCQCTSYASYKALEKWGIYNTWYGNAYNYINAGGRYVPNSGSYTYVDQSPEAHSLAVDVSGEYGHVMWVESVNDDGSINVSEYNVNWPSIGCYIGSFCSRDYVGSSGLYFVHFD